MYFLLVLFLLLTFTCIVFIFEPFRQPLTVDFLRFLLLMISLVALEPLKAFFLILLTFLPMVTLLIFEPLNASALISVTLYVLLPIVTVDGTVTDALFLAF